MEEELWKALVKTRLITPPVGSPPDQVNWDGCEYSKCGRTDRGVSAFGQVIGIRVRSAKPRPRSGEPGKSATVDSEANGAAATAEPAADGEAEAGEKPFDPIKDELPYIQLLNRVLPPDIRVLAWCPTPPPGFSARFSCKERRYRYFFTQPCFAPGRDGAAAGPAHLDIAAMKAAAGRLVGLHDFRNFCKVDPAKRIANFERRVFHADVVPVAALPVPAFLAETRGRAGPQPPRLFAVEVHGSAFLWHQVRHLVAVLFLVGQGLERPEVVGELLDVAANPRRPKYEMASDAPLVLWDCIFPDLNGGAGLDGEAEQGRSAVSRPDALDWVYVGGDGGAQRRGVGSRDSDGKWGRNGIMDDLWRLWRQRKMDEVLAGMLMDVVARQETGFGSVGPDASASTDGRGRRVEKSTKVFDGGDGPRLVGKYVPVMQKEKMDTVEIINARYAERKGLDGREAMKRKADEDADE